MAKGGMRQQMPLAAAWIDSLRDAFGGEYIDNIMRAGMRGEPVFFASENGHQVGTPPPPPAQPADTGPDDTKYGSKVRYEQRQQQRTGRWG